ncbi:hypothetical protein MTR_4g105350 [Medicago truncatula]|uniref:Transmembrane protein n=1 Tax=Medicago truncatula TaxID=3880 RepID=A0A072URX4_MEDTR|nr:hypothetical protein MTR_4g105350 [Medicago truncatula]
MKIYRLLFFSLYGLLARPMQITKMSFRFYNLEHICIFRNIYYGQLRSIKGTSPPSFTFSHSPFTLSLYIIPKSEHRKSCPNLEFCCSKAPHFNPCQPAWKKVQHLILGA